MNSKQLRSRLITLRRLTADVEHRLPPAHKNLADKLFVLDGYGSRHASGVHDDDGPNHASELTAVEAAANARLGDLRDLTGQLVNGEMVTAHQPGPALMLRRIETLIDTATTAADTLIRIADGNLTPEDAKHLRCAGTGDETGADCTNWQSTSRDDGRCDHCGQHVDAQARADKAAYFRKYRANKAGR